MKCQLVLIACVVSAVCALSLTPEQQEKLKKYHADCIAETKMDEKEIKNAKNGKFSDSALLKKYVFCNLRKANLVNREGALNAEVLKAKMPKDTNMLAAEVIIQICKTQSGADAPEKAYNIYRCFYEATPTHVSLI